jgi:voltage-gated potassium channel
MSGAGGSAGTRLPLRALVRAVARSLGTVVVVVGLYFLLPLGRPFGWGTVLWLALGLAAVGLLVAWQVRSILRAPYPALRAGESVGLTLLVFLQLFAAAYVVLSSTDAQAFSEPLNKVDALYFVVTVFATVGFGDIAPVTEVARVLTTVQMAGDLVLVGLVVRVLFAAVDRGRAARHDIDARHDVTAPGGVPSRGRTPDR